MAIPLPGSFGTALLQGVNQGGGLFERMINPVIKRKALEQANVHHAQNLQFRQQQEKRLLEELAMHQKLFPYQVAHMQAQTGQANAAAQKANALAALYNGTFGQGPIDNGAQSYYNNGINSGAPLVAPPSQETIQQGFGGQYPHMGEEEVIVEGDPRKTPMDRATGLPGFSKAETHYDSNGALITRYPSGKVTKSQVGPTAESIEQSKGVGKFKAEAYGGAVNAVNGLIAQKENLDRLASLLEQNPHPEDVIGPLNQWATKVAGSPEDQAFLGEVASTSGNILLDVSKDVKGAWTGKDIAMVNSIKLNPSDRFFVALGKLKAQGELNDLAQKRISLYADLIQQGVPPHVALGQSQKLTDIAPVVSKYEKIIKDAKNRDAVNQGKNPNFDSQEDAAAFLKNLTPKEKMRLFNKAAS